MTTTTEKINAERQRRNVEAMAMVPLAKRVQIARLGIQWARNRSLFSNETTARLSKMSNKKVSKLFDIVAAQLQIGSVYEAFTIAEQILSRRAK